MTYLFGLLLLLLLAVACRADLTRFVLPNWVNLLLLATGLTHSVLLQNPQPVDAVIGALIGGGVLGTLAVAYRRFRGVDGIGMGDVKFTTAAGAWLGWMGIPPMLLVASLLGLTYAGAVALAKGKFDATTRIPFGPFLAAGTLTSWLMLKAA